MKQYCDCVALGAYKFVLHIYQWEISTLLAGKYCHLFGNWLRQNLDSCTTHEVNCSEGEDQWQAMFFARDVQLVKQVSCNIWTNFFI